MRKKTINLLQERSAPQTFWERIYTWVTNTCRVIVVVTELLVLVAFGWRFILDRRLNDLKENIEIKGDVLKSLSDQEYELRELQDKLSAYETLWLASSNFSPLVEEINNYIPVGTDELTVSYSKTREGDFLSIGGEVGRSYIGTLENSLKESENFTDVTLAAIEKKSGGGDVYTFSITAKIKLDQTRETFWENGTETEPAS